jgi:hypothetical protein
MSSINLRSTSNNAKRKSANTLSQLIGDDDSLVSGTRNTSRRNGLSLAQSVAASSSRIPEATSSSRNRVAATAALTATRGDAPNIQPHLAAARPTVVMDVGNDLADVNLSIQDLLNLGKNSESSINNLIVNFSSETLTFPPRVYFP